MSLEEVIEKNTIAICKLTELFNCSPIDGVQEKPKRTRRTKAQKAADDAKTTETEPTDGLDMFSSNIDEDEEKKESSTTDIFGESESKDVEVAVTLEDVRGAAKELVECGSGQKGLEAASGIISGLGFTKLSEVTKDKYRELFDALKGAVTKWKM